MQPFDLVVRDGKTGFVFFNIEGNLYEYDAAAHLLSIKDGRLLISEEFANELGRPADAGAVVGEDFDRRRPCIRSKSRRSLMVQSNRRSCRRCGAARSGGSEFCAGA